jgi:hypothetical protein
MGFDPADDMVDRLGVRDRAWPLVLSQHFAGRVLADETRFGSSTWPLPRRLHFFPRSA